MSILEISYLNTIPWTTLMIELYCAPIWDSLVMYIHIDLIITHNPQEEVLDDTLYGRGGGYW